MPRIIITEPGKSAQPYRLKIDRAETKIGRGSDNDIIIDAGSASTHHCVMKRGSGGFSLEDLGSTNGLKTDRTFFQIIDLIDGMLVNIGDDVTLEFTLTEEEIAELGSEEFKRQQQPMLPKVKPIPEKEELATKEVFLKEEQEEDSYKSPSVVKNSMSTIFFLLFAILALALGFSIRHYQDVLMDQAEDAPEAPGNLAAPE